MNSRLVIKDLEFESLYSDYSINEEIKKLFLNEENYIKMDKYDFISENTDLSRRENLAIYFQKEEEDIITSNMYICENLYCDADRFVNIKYDFVYIFNEECSSSIKVLKYGIDRIIYKKILEYSTDIKESQRDMLLSRIEKINQFLINLKFLK